MAKTIQDLRREKGFRSSREFADAIGVSPSSLSRYDKDPDTIPVKVAWAMADKLGCSIDEIVGREHVTSGKSDLQDAYDAMGPDARALVDEFMEFARAKDERAKRERRAQEDRKYDAYAYRYERMFLDSLADGADFGSMVVFGSPAEERAAFESFLYDKAAEKWRPGVEEELLADEEDLRGGMGKVGSDEVEHFSEEYIQNWLAESREQMEAEQRAKDKEVVDKIMEAYDRSHAADLSWGQQVSVEYQPIRFP